MLARKQCNNPADFFNKDFQKYKNGFAANGELKRGKKQNFLNNEHV